MQNTLKFDGSRIVIIFIVIDFLINTRQFIANQQIKSAFATNCIILIHWKISINLFINSQRHFLD